MVKYQEQISFGFNIIIEDYSETCSDKDFSFLAYSDDFKGLCTKGDSKEDVLRKLKTAIKCLLSYQFKMDIENIK